MKKLTTAYVMLGTSSNCPDIRYATGFVAPDDVIVISLPRKTVLVVSPMEYGRALKQASGCVVETPQTLKLPKDCSRSTGQWALGALMKYGVDEIQVDARFPLGPALEIEKNGIPVKIADNCRLKKSRIVKRPDEIACIAHAQKAARAAMKAVGLAIAQAQVRKDGVLLWQARVLTSELAREIARKEVLRFDCIDEDTIIAGGVQGTDPHECGSGPLRTGEWIVCDIFPRSLRTGYWGDMTRTFMNGNPSPEHKRMYAAVRKAQKTALSMIRPGASGRAVHEAVCRCFAEADFNTFTGTDDKPRGFFHGTGHGVGLEIHEEPRLSTGGGILRRNMVVTVEPGLYYPELGGVRIEDLVVVGEKGAIVL